MKMVAAHEKIYVRETTGWYANWRWALVWMTQLVFFGLPWLNWNGYPLLLFDLAASKFHVFGLLLGPQDSVYLAAWLIIAVLAVCLAMALVGRIWCGFACPHTVYAEIFMWIERRIEGGRSARMRLDQAPWSAPKFRKKTLKHGAWVLLSAWTGLTFVGYFTPIKTVLHDFLTLALGPWQWFGLLAYGALAYANAGWLREQVCRHMCPSSHLQRALSDRDTLVVTYDRWRAEPRGLRNAKSRAQNPISGECVDCTLCVQVCPGGNDIRQGFDHDCVGCAACIDACNLVMDKIGAPRGLIRYASKRAIERQHRALAVPSTANGGGK